MANGLPAWAAEMRAAKVEVPFQPLTLSSMLVVTMGPLVTSKRHPEKKREHTARPPPLGYWRLRM